MIFDNTDAVETVLKTVNRVAKAECYKWGVQDYEDIAQATLEHLWIIDQKGELDNLKDDIPMMNRVIGMHVRNAIVDERIDYMHFTGNYAYTADEVKRLLDTAVWGGSESLPEVEGRVDVLAAYEMLKPEWQDILFRVYCLGEELPHDSGERSSARRAVDRLVLLLNFGNPKERVNIENVPA